MDEVHRALLRAFRQLITDSGPSCWLQVWELFYGAPPIRQRIRRNALAVIARRPQISLEAQDLEQEAWLLLGSKLRSSPDLRIDWERAATTFSSWLNVVTLRLVLKAARRLATHREFSHADVEPSIVEFRPGEIDLEECLERLDRNQHLVLMLYLRGHTLREICLATNHSFAQVRRLLREAHQRLRNHL